VHSLWYFKLDLMTSAKAAESPADAQNKPFYVKISSLDQTMIIKLQHCWEFFFPLKETGTLIHPHLTADRYDLTNLK